MHFARMVPYVTQPTKNYCTSKCDEISNSEGLCYVEKEIDRICCVCINVIMIFYVSLYIVNCELVILG